MTTNSCPICSFRRVDTSTVHISTPRPSFSNTFMALFTSCAVKTKIFLSLCAKFKVGTGSFGGLPTQRPRETDGGYTRGYCGKTIYCGLTWSMTMNLVFVGGADLDRVPWMVPYCTTFKKARCDPPSAASSWRTDYILIVSFSIRRRICSCIFSRRLMETTDELVHFLDGLGYMSECE